MVTKTISTVHGSSYVEWGTIIAGAILASAISLILVQFGNGLGLTAAASLEGRQSAQGVIFTIGIWIFITQALASMGGGYIAGRMRSPMENAATHESEIRDGAHGLIVWATSTVMVAIAVTVAAGLASFATEHTTEAEAHVRQVTDLAKQASLIFGFATAAGAVVSAVAAWGMAVVGGEHRDNAVDGTRYISFRSNNKRKK